MAQIDDLLTYINNNMPLRSSHLTKDHPDVGGYDDDPNGGGAPTILQGSPLGTWFHEHTLDRWWRKDTSEWRLFGAGGPGSLPATTGDIAFTVDPDDANPAPSPPATVVFYSQTQVDAYLSSQGATVFEHAIGPWNAIAPFIRNKITITLAGTVHRPEVGAHGSYAVWDFTGKTFIGGGAFDLLGDDTISNYTQIHAGGTVTAHQVGSWDPYMDFAASTFPTDGSLRGYFAVTSNGYVGQIWKHTDSRLYLAKDLAPAPVNGTTTCTVRRPNTELRKSLDDVNTYTTGLVGGGSTLWIDTGPLYDSAIYPVVNVKDIVTDAFQTNNVEVYTNNAPCWLTRFVVDKWGSLKGGDGPGLRVSKNCVAYLFDCGLRGEPNGTGASEDMIGTTYGATVALVNSVVMGGDNGNRIRDGYIYLYSSVFTSVGNGSASRMLRIEQSVLAVVDSIYAWPGVRTTFEDSLSGIDALELDAGAEVLALYALTANFKDIGGACVKVGPNVVFDMEAGGSPGFFDQGGNSDVGWEIVGPFASVKIDDATDITGTNGDVRMPDGTVYSYTDIESDGPLADLIAFSAVDKQP